MHIASQLCQALKISGPFNVQFLAQEGASSSMRSVQVIECNLRASRTTPFVSKTINLNFIELATRVMLGLDVKPMRVQLMDFNFIACKVPMFSFLRLSGADPRVGVEMQSTGEVACFGRDAHEAFLKGMLAAGLKLPPSGCGVMLSLGGREHKKEFLPYANLLVKMGYKLCGTSRTVEFMRSQWPVDGHTLSIAELHHANDARKPNVVSEIQEGKVKLVITTPSQRDSGGETAGYKLRRRALDSGIALIIDLRQAMMLVDALYQKWCVEERKESFWTIESWQQCHNIG
jgi:carbamoyl-phosphate synthase/aspartate carbamoyltransferase